jgi:hypothetical protein
VSVSSSFLWRFLEDVWDLLPTEDRKLFEAYWSAQLQIAANLEQKTIEAGLSTEVANVPVFLTERWDHFLMNEDFCDLFTSADELMLMAFAAVPLLRETAFYDTVKVTNNAGAIFHEETIKFFDDSVRGLRYGGLVEGTLSVSLIGKHIEGTGATIPLPAPGDPIDVIVASGAFSEAEPGMTLKVTAAVPGNPIGIYNIRAVTDNNTVYIEGTFPTTATGVAFEIDEKLVEYTANRDYAVNLADGTLQAIPEGRIPPTELLAVRYNHDEYTRGVDYEIDEIRGTVRRVEGTSIPNGGVVSAQYTYNATATLPMSGTTGATDFAKLTDNNQDFSTLLDNRTLTIPSGPNTGTYQINSVLSAHEIQVAGSFPVDQQTNVIYSIDAFPHGVKVAKDIASIPYLQDLVDDPTVFFVEGADYVVRDGILAVRSAFRLSDIGPSDIRERQSWAENVKIDKETPYRNFGVLIDFYRSNSESYKLALQGLWYTFWTGSTPGNLGRGLQILLGLPFARKTGTVTRLDVDLAVIDITDSRGSIITYTIPSGLDPRVEFGQAVDRFEALTTGVQIIDRNNEPGFVASRLGRAGISKFLTENASQGVGDTDETKALELLEHHLFLPQVLTEAITQRVNVDELITFLDNMKPQWTEYVFSFAVEESETVFISEEVSALNQAKDLTATVGNNQINQAAGILDFRAQSAAALPVAPPPPTTTPAAHTLIPVARTTGRILVGGTQAAGNFRDSGINFEDVGIDRFDTVRIDEGVHIGAWQVIRRISANTLSLNIPDVDITPAVNINYVVFPVERMMDHDAVNLRGEHIIKVGTDFTAPSSLNTKTNADLFGAALTNERVKALLLVDIGNVGDEIQAITDADVELNEFDVAASPGVVTRDHEIASAALKRTNNIAVVTDVFAI